MSSLQFLNMDAFLDTSWCPVCDRQILPKRYLVPVAPPPSAPAPAPPPSSPSSSPKNQSADPNMRQRKPPMNRTRTAGGLAHGTGRIKPNGAVKRSDSTKKPSPANSVSSITSEPLKSAAPVKHRTVIDQSPIPLYCSDECQMRDLNNLTGALAPDYNPERYSISLPPAPHNSFSNLEMDRESDSSSSATSSSVLSRSLTSSSNSNSDSGSPTSPTPTKSATNTSSQSQSQQPTACLPKHIATLSQIYNFPPIPPAPPLLSTASPRSTLSTSPSNNSYQSGIMMAARRISETLRPAKHAPGSTNSRADVLARERERKPIPGWTDGSDAWRADVYSFAKPPSPSETEGQGRRDRNDDIERAYGGFAASPHRSRGVYSTLGQNKIDDDVAPRPVVSTASLSSMVGEEERARKTRDELYEKYPLSFSRRSDSRMSLQYQPASSPSYDDPSQCRSLPSVGMRRREVKLVKPGAEGKLLVPNVKMVSRSPPQTGGAGSAYSYSSSSTTTASWYPSSRRSMGSVPSIRSPLSRVGSDVGFMGGLEEETGDVYDEPLDDISDDDRWRRLERGGPTKEERERERRERLIVGGAMSTTGVESSGSLPTPRRPVVETRSWSYDNLLTYPAMPLPVKKVKRKERRIVDGEEKEVEVEVEVCEAKRLFLFPGKEILRA